MKLLKRAALICLAAMLLLCTAACGKAETEPAEPTGTPYVPPTKEEVLSTAEKTAELAEQINKASDFCELELLGFSEISGEDAAEYGIDAPQMVMSIAGTDVVGYYFIYPTDSSDRRLVQINIEAQPYHLCGITIGSLVSDAETKLSGLGFGNVEHIEINDSSAIMTCSQYHMTVSLSYDRANSQITAISVAVHDDASSTD